jgi:hypothetical protein
MMAVLTRANNIDESIAKGEEFEYFIRKQLFTHDDYDMLERTHDYTSDENEFVESSKNPDFKFRSRKSGKVFFVEAKYRSVLYNGKFTCKSYQFKRYRAIDRKIPVCIIIGVGHQPESPEQVYLIPMKDINVTYFMLFRSFLNKYQIPLTPMHECLKAINVVVESL